MTDRLHYVRIPKGMGGRAESVRLCSVLADKPYVDVLHSPQELAELADKNPYRQVPVLETGDGRWIAQSLAIIHHIGLGTDVWPENPDLLTRALTVGMGGYDFYQHFGSFPAGDESAKARFEGRRAPQFMKALGVLYESSEFAVGTTPCFADCIVHEAVAWVVRRNDVSKALFEATPSLVAFQRRFEAIPSIQAFMERQAAARQVDDSV